MVSQGTKKRIAIFDEYTGAWQEFTASGSTIPLMESGVTTPKPRAFLGPQDKQIGAVVLLFPPPMDDSGFTQAASSIKRHPAQDVFVVVDSDTVRIPGIAADNKLTNWIRFLKANSAKVLGRVNTSFSVATRDMVEDIVTKWKNMYGEDLDGIYLDNIAHYSRTTEEYYKPLVDIIKKEKGFKYVVGSLGTSAELINTTPENVESLVRDVDFDILILYEGKNFPEPANFAQGWMQKYPRSKMGIIITGVDADENVQKMQDFIMQLVGTYKAVGYVYVNSDSGARTNNPYMALSSLFEAQLQTMDMLAQSEGNLNSRSRSAPTARGDIITVGEGGEIIVEDTTTTTTKVEEDIIVEDLSQPPVNPVRDLEKDINGIRKIYPDATAENFQEWFFNERDPIKDPQLHDWQSANLKKMQDGSDAWYLDGGSKGQVRLAGKSKPGTFFEDATELTIYFKWLHDTKLPKGKTRGKYWQVYLRGGDHSNQKGRGGEASCYKARITSAGQVYLVKEIQHDPPGYTNNIAGRKISFPKDTIKGPWVGMKLVVYNIQEHDNGPVWVKVECWIDSTCTSKVGSLDTRKQKWVKAAEHIDKGGWRCSDMKKPTKWPSVDYNSKTPDVRQPNEIISKPGGTKEFGNIGAFRTDFRASAIKFFNIRQIQNPSHAD